MGTKKIVLLFLLFLLASVMPVGRVYADEPPVVEDAPVCVVGELPAFLPWISLRQHGHDEIQSSSPWIASFAYGDDAFAAYAEPIENLSCWRHTHYQQYHCWKWKCNRVEQLEDGTWLIECSWKYGRYCRRWYTHGPHCRV